MTVSVTVNTFVEPAQAAGLKPHELHGLLEPIASKIIEMDGGETLYELPDHEQAALLDFLQQMAANKPAEAMLEANGNPDVKKRRKKHEEPAQDQLDLSFLVPAPPAAHQPEPAKTEHQQEPERVFDIRRAVIDSETGEILNEDQCWRTLGFKPPMPLHVMASDEDRVKAAVMVIGMAQQKMDNIAKLAADDIRAISKVAKDFQTAWQPLIDAYAIPACKEEKKKSCRITSDFKVFYKKQREKQVNRAEVIEWLRKQPKKTLELLQVTWEPKFKTENLEPFVESLGIPGFDYIEGANEWHECRVGTERAWSPTKALEAIDHAMKALEVHAGE